MHAAMSTFFCGTKILERMPKRQSLQEAGSILDSNQIETLTQELTARMHSMQAAEQKLDPQALLDHFSDEEGFCVYSDGQRVDFETLAEGVTTTYNEVESISGTIGRLDVRVLSPEHGLVAAEFREEVVTRDGRKSSNKGVATWLWHRTDEGWKIVYGQIGHEDENQMTLSASVD
jgi:ketosteroid isomerase-like protein